MRVLLFGLAAAVAMWLALMCLLVLLGRRTAARELATLLPNLLVLFRGLLRDARVPRRAKLLLGVGVIWIASPIDLIPEFIPFIGPLDDAVMAALVLRHVLKHAGSEVVPEHWRGDPSTLDLLLRFSGLPRAVQARGADDTVREE